VSRALLAYALGAMQRRAGRNLAIAIGLAVVVMAFATVLFTSEGLRSVSQRYAREAPSLTVERLVGGRAALVDVADAPRLAAISGVRSVEPRVWGYLYLAALEANVTIVSSADVSEIASGAPTLQDGEALFGSEVAHALGLRAGDRVAVSVAESGGEGIPLPQFLRVRALLDRRSALLAGDLVIVNPSTARALLDVPADRATDLAVDVFPPEESGVVAAAIVDAMHGARVVDRETLGRGFELTFDARAGLLSATLLPALLALLLLAWERLTGLSDEERREIGVLKAIGWTTSDVLSARLLEAGLVALSGSALGLVLAYLHAFVLGAPLLAPALFGWSNLRPALVIAPATDPVELLMLLAAVVVPFAGISVVPAWRAANVDPDRLLR
jgi:ABC-type lipoprotein release transport system permease subunit